MRPRPVLATSRSSAAGSALMRGTHAALRVVCVVTCFALCFPVTETFARVSLEEVVEDLGFSESMKEQVRDGKVVQWTTTEASDRELAVGELLFVEGKPEDFLEEFRAAAGFKVVEQVRGYGRIAGNGSVDEFAGLVLEPNGEKEAKRYLNAEPGDELNLGAKEIAAFRALHVDGLSAAERTKKVEELVRSTLLARYQAYRAKGLSGLAPYERGGGDQRNPGEELLAATKEARILAKHQPVFHKILLKYPAVDAEKLDQGFYWVNIEVFDRPTLILSHRMTLEEDGVYFLADRHYYASHEYNSLQQVGALFPIKDGTLMIYLNRVSTDEAGGFGSSIKHKVARGLMGPYIKEMLANIRARAEQKK